MNWTLGETTANQEEKGRVRFRKFKVSWGQLKTQKKSFYFIYLFRPIFYSIEMAGVIGMTVARQRLETNKARDELQRLQSENKQMERLMECQNVQIKDLQLKNQQMQLLFHDLQADNSKLKSLRRAQKENRREEREKRKEEGVGEDDDRERKDKKKSKKHKKEKKEKHHKSSKSKRKDKTENESKVLEVVQELEGEESGSNSSDDDK